MDSGLDVLQSEPGVEDFLKGNYLETDCSRHTMNERARVTRDERDLFVRHRNYNFERTVVKTQEGQPMTKLDERKPFQRLLKPDQLPPAAVAGSEHIDPNPKEVKQAAK